MTASGKKRRSIRMPLFDYTTGGAFFVTICVRGRRCLFGTVADAQVQLSETGRIVEAAWRAIPNHRPNVRIDAFVVMPNHLHGILRFGPPDAGYQGHPPVGATLASPSSPRVQPTTQGEASLAPTGPPTQSPASSRGPHSRSQHNHPVGATLASPSSPRVQPTTQGEASLAPTGPATQSPATSRARSPRTRAHSSRRQAARRDPPWRSVRSGGRLGLSKGSLGAIVGGFKSAVARDVNRLCGGAAGELWQRNYYEHLIRNDHALERIREYIAANPANWATDPENPAALGSERPADEEGWRV